MNWLMKKRMESQFKKERLKMPHICNDCSHYEVPLMRMSTLTLLLFIILGIIAGYTASYFLSVVFSIFTGMLVLFTLTLIAIKRTKPVCSNCFSDNVKLPKDKTEAIYAKEKERK